VVAAVFVELLLQPAARRVAAIEAIARSFRFVMVATLSWVGRVRHLH
jgi:hypothetical protein